MDDKDRVKQKTDIVELVSEYVKLHKSGSNFKGLCPFHNEKSPSFFVNPEMGMFKCFGCGESGDVFSWLMKMEHLTFPEALQELAKRAGIELPKFQSDTKSQTRQNELTTLSLAREFYHWLLVKHQRGKVALKYLHDRGISDESIKTFQLGWATADWDGLLRYITQTKKIEVQLLLKSGLAVPRSTGPGAYDRFRGRVMFPLQNVRGQTLGFSGRVVPGITPGEKKMGKYINTPETDLYHKRELLYGLEITKPHIKSANSAIIVEGELDVISSYQAGVKNIVAIKGSSLTYEQIMVLRRYAQSLVLALDMDLAGDKAAHKGIQLADEAGLEVKVVQIPEGKDPDDLAQKNPELWEKSIADAIDVYQFLIDSAIRRFNPTSAQGKHQITSEILPLFKQISSPVVQSHWIGELGKRLDVKEQILIQEMQKLRVSPAVVRKDSKTLPNSKLSDTLPATNIPSSSRKLQLQQLLLALLYTKFPQKLFDAEIQKLFSFPWIIRLLDYLQKHHKQRQNKNYKFSADSLPPELQAPLSEAILFLEYTDQSKLKVDKLIYEIRKLKLLEKRQVLIKKIAQLETNKQPAKLADAQKEFDQINIRLVKLKE